MEERRTVVIQPKMAGMLVSKHMCPAYLGEKNGIENFVSWLLRSSSSFFNFSIPSIKAGESCISGVIKA
jgi:hypothetical protein